MEIFMALMNVNDVRIGMIGLGCVGLPLRRLVE
jgi:UDP-N-acetyl-D-mannosaminuronate dehydrogenase